VRLLEPVYKGKTPVSNFLQIGKAWDYIAHRRMIAFWTVMVVMLPLPWLMPACTTAPKGQAH